MPKLVLLNPIRRKRRKARKSAKRRTAAQRAATRKLVALNRRRASPSRARRRKARKSSSRRRLTHVNSGVRKMAKRRRRARYSRNPVSFRRALSNPLAVVKPAVVGAAGALAVNGMVNYLPIPDSMKTGNMLLLTKAGLALMIGTLGPKLPVIGRHAAKMAEGALTVQMADLGKQLAMQYGYNLSGTGFVNPALVMNRKQPLLAGTGAYVGPYRGVQGMRGRMGMYVR